MRDHPQAIILMGVSGSGKTAVGKQLSQRLGWPFFDGDDFHPKANVDKMAAGIPLDDDDRAPWLKILHNLIADHLAEGKSLLLACSALKQIYRDQLAEGNPDTVFVHMKGDFDLIMGRMQLRAGHYMKAEMLRSQFETLEEPTGALIVDIGQNLDRITKEIIAQLHLR
jgi:gluconokinase